MAAPPPPSSKVTIIQAEAGARYSSSGLAAGGAPHVRHSYSGERGGNDGVPWHERGVAKKTTETWLGMHPAAQTYLSFPAVFAVCLIAILPWYFAAQSDYAESAAGSKYPWNYSSVDDGLSISIQIQVIDPITLKLSTTITTTPIGFFSLANLTNSSEFEGVFYAVQSALTKFTGVTWVNVTSVTLFIIINSGGVRVTGTSSLGDYTPSVSPQLNLNQDVPYTKFPFDKYSTGLTITVYMEINGTALDPVSGSEVPDTQYFAPVPVKVDIKSSLVGFNELFAINSFGPATIDEYAIYHINSTKLNIDVNINRNSFSQGLSIYVVVIMWGLATGAIVMAIDLTMIRNKKDLNPTCASVCASMLFSLPSLRQVQSGIPPLALYASIDIWSYFINMGLISVALILLLGKLSWQNGEIPSPRKKN